MLNIFVDKAYDLAPTEAKAKVCLERIGGDPE